MSDTKKQNKTIVSLSTFQKKEVRGKEERMIMVLPGFFVAKNSDEKIYAQIINVSTTGMGIQCQSKLQPKQKITLMTLDRDFEFEVIWCEATEHETHGFTVGLNSIATDINICDYFYNVRSIRAV